MNRFAFFRDDGRWLGAGVLMTFASSFGQTYFIASFGGVWREEFNLSHGDWGALYMTATLASAAVLTQAGKLADSLPVRRLALMVLGAFTAVALGVSAAPGWLMLGVMVFGLRFCGQGMMSHVAMTAMGKWFRAKRARAMATAGLGYALGEALLPAAALSVTAGIGWRNAWLVIAGAILLCYTPALAWLLKREREPEGAAGAFGPAEGMEGRSWSRSEMMRHWVFWALLPGIIAPSWVGTVIFFQTAQIAEAKGWNLIAYTGAAFPAYSAMAVISGFAFGWAADRFGPARLLPVYLLGWAGGSALLGLAGGLWSGVAAFLVAGIGSGGVSVVIGALLPQLYGARWLGGIRAIATAAMVLASAFGPGVSGALLDAGVGVETQCLGMAAYMLLVSLWFLPVSARTRALLARGAD